MCLVAEQLDGLQRVDRAHEDAGINSGPSSFVVIVRNGEREHFPIAVLVRLFQELEESGEPRPRTSDLLDVCR